MDEVEQLLKAQSKWLENISREILGDSPRPSLNRDVDELHRAGVRAARERIDRLEAQRDAILRRVDAAIAAERSIVERLEANIEEARPAKASTGSARPKAAAADSGGAARTKRAPAKTAPPPARKAAAKTRKSGTARAKKAGPRKRAKRR